jgi:lysophospholipase L1-like esterase
MTTRADASGGLFIINNIMRYFKILSFAISSLLVSNQSFSQDWRVFANIDRYKEANLSIGEPTQGVDRIVFMGNSITEGWSTYMPEFFQETGYVNRGIGGQTTPQMLLRFRTDVIELEPKAVVILAGTNDLAGNTGFTPTETIVGNIKSMAELASQNGIKVILSSVLPAIDYPWKPGLEPSSKIISINDRLKEYADENDFVYLDYYSSLVDDNGGLKVPEYTSADDLVHPNKAGYLVMEKLAQEAIDKALERK